MMERINKEQCV